MHHVANRVFQSANDLHIRHLALIRRMLITFDHTLSHPGKVLTRCHVESVHHEIKALAAPPAAPSSSNRRRLSLLLRPLPPHRPRQMGQRRLQNLHPRPGPRPPRRARPLPQKQTPTATKTDRLAKIKCLHLQDNPSESRLYPQNPAILTRSPRLNPFGSKTLTHFRGRVGAKLKHSMPNSNVQIHPPSKKRPSGPGLVGTFFGAGLLKPGPGTYGSSPPSCSGSPPPNLHPSPIASPLHRHRRNHRHPDRHPSRHHRRPRIRPRRPRPRRHRRGRRPAHRPHLLPPRLGPRHPRPLLFRLFDILKPPPSASSNASPPAPASCSTT